ncbi:hypothetical protein KRX56_09170 [Dermabacteraceae bacterium TAE3-ERU27]|nr:hypothetical protein [Dermabacteraceae bacterium TAE3-ERU27]
MGALKPWHFVALLIFVGSLVFLFLAGLVLFLFSKFLVNRHDERAREQMQSEMRSEAAKQVADALRERQKQ